MRKQIAVALISSALLGMAGTTQAGNSGHGHDGRYSGNHHGEKFRGYNRPHRGDRHHHRRHDDLGKGLAIVAGVVVLGSIIHAINQDASQRVEHRPPPPVPMQDYWYRVDADGECVEVRLNQQGREVWTYVDPSFCN